MTHSLIPALFFTVALLVTTAYFLLGAVPLLVLEHDTPLDGRFVRGFFNTYYLAVMFTASGAALSYAWVGRFGFGAGAAGLALLAAMLRKKFLPRMDHLRARIEAGHAEAIAGFRRLHVAAILMNVTQLALIVWTLIAFSLK
ncbi:hypothetical protein WG902_16715 [Ramlibacter sp. PS3R-8]|uniref:hypothetical protein n=1 Tax=Ramlibacter sp. PS3R-8 TaxID=3133437 RepID=UPI0030B752D8